MGRGRIVRGYLGHFWGHVGGSGGDMMFAELVGAMGTCGGVLPPVSFTVVPCPHRNGRCGREWDGERVSV